MKLVKLWKCVRVTPGKRKVSCYIDDSDDAEKLTYYCKSFTVAPRNAPIFAFETRDAAAEWIKCRAGLALYEAKGTVSKARAFKKMYRSEDWPEGTVFANRLKLIKKLDSGAKPVKV